ncbi:MAG: geranyltranstransferase [Pseudomonadota bacterium]|jgi:farnesyl diphosphate synthase/geranylgeranyl diphosphate synthase type II
MPFNLSEYLNAHTHTCNRWLEDALPPAVPGSEHLMAAMRYSLLQGGKRLRPILAIAAAEACGGVTPATQAVAVALEAMHAYSLIHDDLPAMDNDTLRRGQPTCHIAYGEATAILAGDALQTLAFSQLAAAQAPAEIRLALIQKLAEASGASGMVAGQALDMAATDKTITLQQLEVLHRHKTGALIKAAVVMGALSSGSAFGEKTAASGEKTEEAARLTALTHYACAIGLAFQVQDDILDVIGDTTTLGKQQGADQTLNKSTYVSLLGLEAARSHAQTLVNTACASLKEFDARAEPLRALARYVVERGF